jgi:acyl carrier protein
MQERTEQIKSLIIDRLNLKINVANFSNDAPLFKTIEQGGIGLDSVDALEISVGIMNEFDVEVTDEDMHIFESVNTINDFIETQLVGV